MKKFTFVLLALFAAVAVSAQITYEGTKYIVRFGSSVQRITARIIDAPFSEQDGMFVGEYFMTTDVGLVDGDTHYNVYDSNLSLVKSFLIKGQFFGVPVGTYSSDLYVWNFISYGIFTTDGKWACLVTEYQSENLVDSQGTILGTVKKVKSLRVVDEDGTVLSTIPYTGDTQRTTLCLVNIGGIYKLFVPTGDDSSSMPYAYDIYSLPGKGEPASVSNPSSPKRAAHKIAREGQILVETDTNTFDLRGQEVK